MFRFISVYLHNTKLLSVNASIIQRIFCLLQNWKELFYWPWPWTYWSTYLSFKIYLSNLKHTYIVAFRIIWRHLLTMTLNYCPTFFCLATSISLEGLNVEHGDEFRGKSPIFCGSNVKNNEFVRQKEIKVMVCVHLTSLSKIQASGKKTPDYLRTSAQ